MILTVIEKKKTLDYLKSGNEIAVAAGYVIDHKTQKLTRIPLIALSDNVSDWTTEDIYNMEHNDEIFNEEIIKRILKQSN